MKKTKLYLTEIEWHFVIHSLNAFQTKLHSEGKYTDTVDEALLKVIAAPIKRVKIRQPSGTLKE